MKLPKNYSIILLFCLAGMLIGFDNADEVKTIEINAISGMQFDLVRFKVNPGEKIRLTLHNQDEMTHNLLLTTPGNREEIVSQALKLADGEANDYIPENENVLAAIPLLSPDQSYTISFTAPQKEGVYPYVCTYPGHGEVMYGAMYVTKNLLPPLATDQHIPEQRREKEDTTHVQASGHPYNMVLPSIYRAFMPQSGPASIAVGMLGDISYCWDAGKCRLRYAWKGGFVDMERTWSGKGMERADIVGVIFYREDVDFPITIGDKQRIPEANFKGYRMQNRYPTFWYTLDKINVEERILPTFDQPGFQRIFKLRNNQDTLLIKIPDQEGISITVNQGEKTAKGFRLSPEEAENFIITIQETGKAESI